MMLATSLAFVLGMAFQFAMAENSGEESYPHERAWVDSLQPKTKWVKFQGRLMAENLYRGAPSKGIDDAWGRYTTSPWFDGGAVVLGVSREEVARSWKDSDEDWFNSTVRLAPQNGGGYMATLEIFHQLHCLVCARVLICSTSSSVLEGLQVFRTCFVNIHTLATISWKGPRQHLNSGLTLVRLRWAQQPITPFCANPAEQITASTYSAKF